MGSKVNNGGLWANTNQYADEATAHVPDPTIRYYTTRQRCDLAATEYCDMQGYGGYKFLGYIKQRAAYLATAIAPSGRGKMSKVSVTFHVSEDLTIYQGGQRQIDLHHRIPTKYKE